MLREDVLREVELRELGLREDERDRLLELLERDRLLVVPVRDRLEEAERRERELDGLVRWSRGISARMTSFTSRPSSA